MTSLPAGQVMAAATQSGSRAIVDRMRTKSAPHLRRLITGQFHAGIFLTIPDNFASGILYPTSVWHFSETSLSS